LDEFFQKFILKAFHINSFLPKQGLDFDYFVYV
jgi:hypothetical protein